ncbi:MAG: alpha amylase catalytic region [Acidobacteria bacterium]|nr:alpha amylase catalytic region [Acidobacteriota bacterium]
MVQSNDLDGRSRVIIEGAQPEVDDGRFPAKRVEGDRVVVEADIFADGHDVISAVMLWRHASESESHAVRMQPLVNDRWRAELDVDRLGDYFFTFEAWIDHFLTWHRDLRKRVAAKQADLDVQLTIGLEMIRAATLRANGRDRRKLELYVKTLEADEPLQEKLEEVWSEDLLALMWRNAERHFVTRYRHEVRIEVDRKRAAFSTWYELFPRSLGKSGAHGTLRDLEAELPRIAGMGFDVLYLPPIHPIGLAHRKGTNNRVTTEEGDVGSPWAIGGTEGGHTSLHPELGTMEDFERLVGRAQSLGMELALDIAFQASPDHPYVREHGDWFLRRPDGSVQYAENPPKKYQDIYPFHFETGNWALLWEELRQVFQFWIDKGVRIFRVDNPHTKPLPFWHWCLNELRRENRDLIFLAEAFTRPKIMYWLAKGGFSQSYTYFAWRNTAEEIREYFTEITRPPVSDFFRPNAWPNTPDIVPEYLQTGGRSAFVIRLILAATLSANYGMYGPAFERMVSEPREPGSEEYLHSEKYELKRWEPVEDDLSELIALINRLRRENAALQQNATLTFHTTSNASLLCYSKAAGDNVIIAVVSVDPHNPQSGWLELDLEALNLDDKRPFQVHDLLSGARHSWTGPRNFVQLNPDIIPAHLFRIRRKVRSERDFEYYL